MVGRRGVSFSSFSFSPESKGSGKANKTDPAMDDDMNVDPSPVSAFLATSTVIDSPPIESDSNAMDVAETTTYKVSATSADPHTSTGRQIDNDSVSKEIEGGQLEEINDVKDEDEDDDGVNYEDYDDDRSSFASELGDLKADLLAFLGGDFAYAYSSLLPNAPNPALDIEGLGPIGLPLSPHDAHLIISSAALGHETETKIDTSASVGHTWEIEPRRLKFRNKAWDKWMRETVVQEAAKTLGFPISGVPPTCELYKLLLFEPGSHYSPHQDTVVAQNVFATIMIVLPSPYTGGEVHVSHASSKQVFAFDADSLLSTAVMAWYTDVQHELKTVTSGYRLALSYNLIHVTPGVAPPRLPDMHDSITSLRRVLKKWRMEKYADFEPRMLGHILKHQYSPEELTAGFKALKGQDACMVAELIPPAEEQEFFVGLANLSYYLYGDTDGDKYHEYRCNKRGRWVRHDESSDEAEDDEVPGMDKVHLETLTVDDLVDLEGNMPVGDKQIPFDRDDLVYEDPLDEDPDEKKYEVHSESDVTVEHWYSRTILILMPDHCVRDILYKAGGSTYALDQLRRATLERPNNPSVEDLSYANLVVNDPRHLELSVYVTMAHFSITWKNLDLWKKTLCAGSWDNSSILPVEELVAGWKAFTFESVSSSFEQVALQAPEISTAISFTRNLVESGPFEDREISRPWAESLMSQLLSYLTAPTAQDVPFLLDATRQKGLSYITDTLIPQLKKTPGLYDFWVSLVKALAANRASLTESWERVTSGPESGEAEYEVTIQHCLDVVVVNWEDGIPVPSRRHQPLEQSSITLTSRAIEILDLCFDLDNLLPCKQLLDLLTKKTSTHDECFETKFQTLYRPIISHTRQRLAAKDSTDICSEPFAEFMDLMVLTLKDPSSVDVPWIIDVLQAKGARYIMQSFIRHLEKNVTLYHFWLQFIASLTETEGSIAQKSSPINSDPNTSVRKLIEHSLSIIVTNWEHGLSCATTYAYDAPDAVSPSSRIIELVKLCISTRFLDPLTRLWSLVVKAKPVSSRESYRLVYSPLIPELRQVLASRNMDLSVPPFVELIQVLLGSYLEKLGLPSDAVVEARKLGCKCADCRKLDDFLMSAQTEQTFRFPQARRTHLENRMSSAEDIVSFSTVRNGNPHGLVVKKLSVDNAWGSQNERKDQTLTFLRNVGDDNVLAKIAGARYADVMKAIQGTQKFLLPWNTAGNGVPSSSNSAGGKALGASSSSSTSAPNVPPSVPGHGCLSNSSHSSASHSTLSLSQAAKPQEPPHHHDHLAHTPDPIAVPSIVSASNSVPAPAGTKKRKRVR